MAIWNGLGLVILAEDADANEAQRDTDHVHVSEVDRRYRDTVSGDVTTRPARRPPAPAALIGASALGGLIGAGAARPARRRA